MISPPKLKICTSPNKVTKINSKARNDEITFSGSFRRFTIHGMLQQPHRSHDAPEPRATAGPPAQQGLQHLRPARAASAASHTRRTHRRALSSPDAPGANAGTCAAGAAVHREHELPAALVPGPVPPCFSKRTQWLIDTRSLERRILQRSVFILSLLLEKNSVSAEFLQMFSHCRSKFGQIQPNTLDVQTNSSLNFA